MEGILITIGDFELFIHQTIVIWFGICIVVGILLAWAGSKFKKADPTKAPTGVVLVFEQVVNMCMNIIKGNLSEKTWQYLPFMGTVMILMLISNLMGLIGLQPPTSNISVTATLAITFVLTIHFSEIKEKGLKGKWKSLLDPIPFLFPLNIIGDVALPLSLTLRLFGNLLGGSIIIALLYLLIEMLLPASVVLLGITPFLHMYFDIFTACIQTYIFFTLVSFNLGDAIIDSGE